MEALLQASITFPAVIYTGVLGLALVYWLFVVLGALDLDILDGGDGGEVVGDVGGAAKGALEGAVKGSVEGAVKGAAEGLGDVDGGEEGLASIMSALDLSRAPATVVLTLLAAFGWFTSVLSLMHAAPLWGSWGLPGWLFKAVVMVVSLLVALPLTSLTVRPLGPLFDTHAAKSHKDLVGREVVISTGRVDERFGQATLADGGAGLILHVRCETPGVLRQGDRALLVNWDADKEVFIVEPLEDVMVERRFQGIAGAGADPSPGAGGGADKAAAGEPEAAAESSAAEQRRHAG